MLAQDLGISVWDLGIPAGVMNGVIVRSIIRLLEGVKELVVRDHVVLN